MNAFIFAQILGAIAAIIFMVSVQFKDKRHIVYFLIAQTLIATSAMIFLGAWSGVTINLLALLPTLYIYHSGRHHHYRVDHTMAIFFSAILFVGWLLTYTAPVDLLALIGGTVYVFSLFQKQENNIRAFLLVNQIAWVSFNLIIGLYTGALFGILFIASDLIAIHHFAKGHRTPRRAVHHWWK
jgi:hypothetical protein